MKIRKIHYLFSFISLPEVNKKIQSRYLVSAGNHKHYKYIKQHRYEKFPNDEQIIWVYHKPIIDIVYEMVKNKQKVITYITDVNFQTVRAIQKQEKGTSGDQISRFIKNHELRIERAYLDEHPYFAYKKLCGYLDIKGEKKDREMFQGVSFSLQKLPENLIILPFLSSLRQKYLNTKELKLKTLDRIKKSNQKEREEALNYWRNMYKIERFYSSTAEDQKAKLEWVINNKFGRGICVSELIEGDGERQGYALWMDDE